jgi:cell division protein FtsL
MHIFLALLQDAPAETTNYMYAGYAVIFIVLAIYLYSLAARNFKLRQDLETLSEIEKQP